MRRTQELVAFRRAVTAICLLLVLLLVALWIRSYNWGEELYGSRAFHWHSGGIYSGAGRLVVTVHRPSAGGTPGIHYLGPYDLKSRRQNLWERQERAIPNVGAFGAGWESDIQFKMMMPHWFLVVLVAGFAYAGWMTQWRFSLRFLLIGLTLTALAVGAFVTALRSGPND